MRDERDTTITGSNEEQENTIDLTDIEQTPETEESMDSEISTNEQAEQKEENSHAAKHKLWGSLFTEGENESSDKSLLESIKQSSKNLDSKWMLSQLPLLAIIMIGSILFVTLRYHAQQQMIEQDRLEKEVLDWKYRSLTRSSELTQSTRQSKIEEILKQRGDTSLTASPEPPFTINVDE